MSKEIIVSIKLRFSKQETIEVQTNDVPTSLILEAINNLARLLASQLIEEAQEEVSPGEYEKYLDARIKVDREILKKLLNN